ncbi:MAG: response regulator transcription factor [Odoribacter sp.]|nr:response regulator transcription factor [Bacteroidales bacterium]MBR2980722.1 response regulator transcription factor [Odoribacter sp.]
MKILVIEDDSSLREIICRALQEERYIVESASTYMQADSKIAGYTYDCILLDIMLPDGSGLKLLEHIRNLKKRENVIIISARNSIEDKVAGLDLGADDYLAKPFHISELIARVKSVLRRGRSHGEFTIELGNVTMHPDSRRVEIEGTEIKLVKKEFDILLYFMQRPSHVIDKGVLAESVWGDYADDSDNFQFVYAQIKNLRRKLEGAGATIEISAVYGFGYKLIIK